MNKHKNRRTFIVSTAVARINWLFSPKASVSPSAMESTVIEHDGDITEAGALRMNQPKREACQKKKNN